VELVLTISNSTKPETLKLNLKPLQCTKALTHTYTDRCGSCVHPWDAQEGGGIALRILFQKNPGIKCQSVTESIDCIGHMPKSFEPNRTYYTEPQYGSINFDQAQQNRVTSLLLSGSVIIIRTLSRVRTGDHISSFRMRIRRGFAGAHQAARASILPGGGRRIRGRSTTCARTSTSALSASNLLFQSTLPVSNEIY